MNRFSSFFVACTLLLFSPVLFAHGTASQATATCNFDSTKQLAVEYQRMTVNSRNPVSVKHAA
jgi:hypothetical protein